jgi:hypothetical protein
VGEELAGSEVISYCLFPISYCRLEKRGIATDADDAHRWENEWPVVIQIRANEAR